MSRRIMRGAAPLISGIDALDQDAATIALRRTEMSDNGSDMYVSGTYDNRWDNGILNPAFRALTAGDFEVVRLGYAPTAPALPGPPTNLHIVN